MAIFVWQLLLFFIIIIKHPDLLDLSMFHFNIGKGFIELKGTVYWGPF